MGQILVVGSINMDIVLRLKRMPLVGETLLGESMTYSPGGKGANQACAVAKLGGNVKMLGCIGSDGFGVDLKQGLSDCGVDVSALKTKDGLPTGTAVISVDERGNNSIVVVAGANGAVDIEYMSAYDELIRECDYVLLQLEIPVETVRYVIKRAHGLGKKVILNPAPVPAGFALDEELCSMIDYITPNETELMLLTGGGDATDAGYMEYMQRAELLYRKGIPNVIVTMGDMGALLRNGDGTCMVPAYPAWAVDTTAAGDCFNGAFVVALSEGKDEKEALDFANAAASIAVTRPGAQASIPTAEEVKEKIG